MDNDPVKEVLRRRLTSQDKINELITTREFPDELKDYASGKINEIAIEMLGEVLMAPVIDTSVSTAKRAKVLYDSLLKEGFTKDDALYLLPALLEGLN